MNGMVWVRLLVGAIWLNGASEKILNADFPRQFSASLKAGGYISQAPAWFQTFMQDAVVPNAELFANLTRVQELALGLGLLLGLFTNLAALGSIAFSLVILISQGGVRLGTGLGAPEFLTINVVVVLLSLIILLAPSAKSVSLDGVLIGARPSLGPLLIGRRIEAEESEKSSSESLG
jgi:thiosulfate dehydrogenase [quinone] large subunit